MAKQRPTDYWKRWGEIMKDAVLDDMKKRNFKKSDKDKINVLQSSKSSGRVKLSKKCQHKNTVLGKSSGKCKKCKDMKSEIRCMDCKKKLGIFCECSVV